MSGNDLYTPLRRPPDRLRVSRTVQVLLGGATGLVILAGLAVLALNNAGSDGEPFATAHVVRQEPAAAAKPPAPPVANDATGSVAGVPPAATPERPIAGTPPLRTDGNGQTSQVENGVTVVRAGPAPTIKGGPLVLKVPGSAVPDDTSALGAAPDPRLVEPSASGPLPRIGQNGARPSQVYAHPPVASEGRPRIALLVGGMGLDRQTTTKAGSLLPGAVTFGFAPYGDDLEAQVQQARKAGHEAVLQMPMEGFGQVGAGLSHMLKVDGGNADRLRWLMSRFTGYAGVGNYLGGRLLGDEAALRPVMQAAADRGLFFVDDGTANRSLALSIAPDLGLPVARADLVLDAKPEPAAMAAAFLRLETMARERGIAVGAATGSASSLAVLSGLVAQLDAQGFALVPVSQAAAGDHPKVSSATDVAPR